LCPFAFLAQEKVSCTSKGFLHKKRFIAQAKVALKCKGFLQPAELCYAAIVMVMIAARPLLLRRGQQATGKIKIK